MTAPLNLADTPERKIEVLSAELRIASAQKELLTSLMQVDQSADALDQTLQRTLEISARLTGAERGSIFLLDSNRATTKAVLIQGDAAAVAQEILVSRVMSEGLAGWVAEHHTVGLVTDTGTDQRWMTMPDQQYIARSALAVPILRQGQLLGLLTLIHSLPDQFTREHARLLQATAAQIALALENARLYASLQSTNDELENRVRARTSELNEAYQQVQAARERLQSLSQQLLDAQEAERRRIARELHDEIGQSLSALKINLQSAQFRPDPTQLADQLADCVAIADGVLEQVRALSLDLRPSLLDDMGLEVAVNWYLQRLARPAGWQARLTAGLRHERLAAELETVSFRVIQESLTNIARHASARQVNVALTELDDDLELLIEDDGVGFDLAAARDRAAHGDSLGLLGISERVALAGGQLTIKSSPEQGTAIRARLPLRGRTDKEPEES